MSTKWCRFQTGDKVSYGRIDGDNVVAIDGEPCNMKPGDVCEVEITGIGILRNPIVAET